MTRDHDKDLKAPPPPTYPPMNPGPIAYYSYGSYNPAHPVVPPNGSTPPRTKGDEGAAGKRGGGAYGASPMQARSRYASKPNSGESPAAAGTKADGSAASHSGSYFPSAEHYSTSEAWHLSPHPPPGYGHPCPPPPPGWVRHTRELAHPPTYWHPYGAPPPPGHSHSIPPPYSAKRDPSHVPPAPAPAPSPSRRKKSSNDVDGRVRATSPTQIQTAHRDEVRNMGCTCKKTRCLKLYCQCFATKLVCGSNCRCLDCYNNNEHDQVRREAMQSISLRNPGAFDSKFKKTGQNAIAPTPVETTSTSRVLAHKLGCKCRKSGCMKKYCECYAGSVKCTSACRCMGCKNMGPPSSTSFDPDTNAPPYPIAPNPHHVPSLPPPPSHHFLAAQNLTFMKHGSPAASEDKKKSQPKTYDHGDIPSLASSSEGTSPGGEATFIKPPSRDGTRTDALLMAAVAMTEFDRSTNGKRYASERLEDTTKRTKTQKDASTREKSLSKVSKSTPKGKK